MSERPGYTPEFPVPVDVPLPAWATVAGEWFDNFAEDVWARPVHRYLGPDNDVELFTIQVVHRDGSVEFPEKVGVYTTDRVDVDDPGELRGLAALLVEAADALAAAQAVAFPVPTDIPLPSWATTATEWDWIDERWYRVVGRDADAYLEVNASQEVLPDGTARTYDLSIDGDNIGRIVTAAQIRRLGTEMIEAADTLEALPAAELDALQAVTR